MILRITQVTEGRSMHTFTFLVLNFVIAFNAFAEMTCDIRIGKSQGIKVVEFGYGNVTLSMMLFKESSAKALHEEMINLQDMGICEEKILAKKCTLKYERQTSANIITMYRGFERWNSWKLKSKTEAQGYVKSLKETGFCS
jgi:hypothetical protein